MFTCTCADAHLQTTVHKHVHIVQMFLNESSDGIRVEVSIDKDSHEDMLDEVDLSKPLSSKSHCQSIDPEDEQLLADLKYLANQTDQ